MARFNASFNQSGSRFNAKFGDHQIIETGDYEKLKNKPQIEGHELIGNSTLPQIGVNTASQSEIEAILYLDV